MVGETRQRLHDALDSSKVIARYTRGLDFAAYQRDGLVRDGVERRLAIIGEALNRAAQLEPSLDDQIPELRQVVGLRNRVIHGYDALDQELIWDLVVNRLPRLRARIAALLGEVDEP